MYNLLPDKISAQIRDWKTHSEYHVSGTLMSLSSMKPEIPSSPSH